MIADQGHAASHGVAQLLTEEWMIDRPDNDGFVSLLPSFIEAVWMQDTERYITDGLRSFLEVIRDRAVRPLVQRLSQPEYHALNGRRNSIIGAPQQRSRAFNMELFAAKLEQWRYTVPSQLRQRVVVFLKLWERVLDRFRPELQCWMRYIVERHCLLHSRNCGTLVDFVFGMIRVKAACSEPGGRIQLVPLEKVDQIRLALLQAMIPYLWERFQEFYRNERNEMSSMDIRPPGSHYGVLQLIRSTLLRRRPWIHRLFPVLVSIGYIANAYCQLRYLLGFSHCTDLQNTVLRHIVRRTTQQDLSSPATNATSPLASTPLIWDRWKIVLPTVGWIMLASSLSLSWGTQMIHWYREKYQELQQAQLRREQCQMGAEEPRRTQFSAHILPVPLLPPETAVVDSLPKGCCLLCNGPLFSMKGKSSRYPTALNGYIYCYTCIVPYVRQHGVCPVTDQVVYDESKQLIRLYAEMAKT
jgi:Pex2 / Pex12 amino terminal region